MAKTRRNPATSVKRYQQFYSPLFEIANYQAKLMKEQIGEEYPETYKEYLHKYARFEADLDDMIRLDIEFIRNRYFNEAQKMYFMKLARSWMLVRQSYLNQDGFGYQKIGNPDLNRFFFDYNIMRHSPRIFTKFLKIVHDSVSYGGDQEHNLKKYYDYQLGFHHRAASLGRGLFCDQFRELVDKVQADSLHFFEPAKVQLRIFNAGGVAPSPAMNWYIKHLSDWKPTPGLPYTASTDNARDQLSHIEDQYNELRKEGKNFIDLKAHPHYEFLRLDDDWTWFAVDKGYCERTGDIMGHCGNRGSVDAGDILLNLGKTYKEGYIPHLTFIINRGFLGEMKGKNNQKPDAKYHPHIMRLLVDPRVLWIQGGGYAPERNFKLEDLGVRHTRYLKKHKPELFSEDDFIRKHKSNPDMLDWIQSNNEIGRLVQASHFMVVPRKGYGYKFIESKWMPFSVLLRNLQAFSLIDDAKGVTDAIKLIGKSNDVDLDKLNEDYNKIAVQGILGILRRKSARKKKGEDYPYKSYRSRTKKKVDEKLRRHLKGTGRNMRASDQAIEVAEQSVIDAHSYDVSGDAEMRLGEELRTRTKLGFYIEFEKGVHIPTLNTQARYACALETFIGQCLELIFSGKRLDQYQEGSAMDLFGTNITSYAENYGFGHDVEHDFSDFVHIFVDEKNNFIDDEPTFNGR